MFTVKEKRIHIHTRKHLTKKKKPKKRKDLCLVTLKIPDLMTTVR